QSRGWLGVTLIMLASLASASCSKNGDPLYPVRGQVLFKGKPVSEALVILHRLDEPDPDTVKPRALTGPDGSFAIFTNEAGDGAPAGKYVVTILGKKKPGSPVRTTRKPEKVPLRPKKHSSNSPQKPPSKPKKKKPKMKPPILPARYENPKTSKLQVEVLEGPNELAPFDLKD